MNDPLEYDFTHLDALLEEVKQQGLDFLNQIDDRPTSISKQTLPDKAVIE